MARQTPTVTVRRTASEVKRYRRYKRIVPIAIGICVLILVIGYVLSVLYMRFGAFTVMVNKLDHLDYALTLSESESFDTYYSRLNAEIFELITNIDGRSLPDNLHTVKDGEHNGDNYIAYTFYCKNAGKSTFDYSYEVYIANATLGIEDAARIRLYVNDEPYVDYASRRTDSIGGPEENTTPFLSRTTVCKKKITNFAPGDVTKFTIVIWLEGNDPECVDRILGGQMKVDMAMNVIMGDDGIGQ